MRAAARPPSARVTVWASVVILVCASDCEMITSGDHDPCDEGSALAQCPCPSAPALTPAGSIRSFLPAHGA